MPSHRFRTPFHIYIVPSSLTRKPIGFGRVDVFRPTRKQGEHIVRKVVRANRREAIRRLRKFVSSQVPRSVSEMKDRQVIERAGRLLARREVWRHSPIPAYVNGSPAKARKKSSTDEASAPSTAAGSAESEDSISIREPRWVHASESAKEARPDRARGGDVILLRASTSGARKGESVTFELFNEAEDPSAPVERVSGTVGELTGERGVAEAEWTVRDLRRGSGGQEITFRATCQGESTSRTGVPVGFAFGRAMSRTRQPRVNWPYAIYEKGAQGEPVHKGTTTPGGEIVAPFPYDDSYVVRRRRA
jgi:hypothetical protein